MSFCTQCGNENRIGAKFCRFCGETIIDESVVESEISAQDLLPLFPMDDSKNNHQELSAPVDLQSESDEAVDSRQEHAGMTPSESTQAVDVSQEAPSTTMDNLPETAVLAKSLNEAHESPGSVNGEPDLLLEEAHPSVSESSEVVDSHQENAGMTLSRGEADDAPFEVLPTGHVLQGRYHILSSSLNPESDKNDPNNREIFTITYEAEDWLRCWNCSNIAIQSDPQPRFCEMCGAEMAATSHPMPLVRLLARPLQAGEQGQDETLEGLAISQDEFFCEQNVYYQIELIPSQSAEPLEELSSLTIRVMNGAALDTGLQRTNNEDSLLVLSLMGLSEARLSPDTASWAERKTALGFYMVADGVGGHMSGEIASGTAVRSLGSGIMQQVFIPEYSGSTKHCGTTFNLDELEAQLKEIVLGANQAILDLRIAEPDNDMGCTLTAALVCVTGKGTVTGIVANVGDSRTYLMRQGKLSQVTLDHSVVARMVEQGVIRPDEIYTHEQRNMIYRSLGDKPDLIVDTFQLELQVGDRLLLCSDGLWEMVRDPIIEDTLLEGYDAQQTCDKLVDLANLSGGADNISVIVVDIRQ